MSAVKTRLSAALLTALGAALFSGGWTPALAGCSDGPEAGVDWTDCRKHNIVARGRDLAGAKMEGVDTIGSDFRETNLQGAHLTKAIMTRVNASRSNLTGADLSKVEASRATFIQANLTNAVLNKAIFYRGDFTESNFTGADLSKAEFSRATFDGARMDQADISFTNLARATFYNAVMDNVNLEGAWLYRTGIDGIDLSTAIGLTSDQVAQACGNADTKLPPEIAVPAGWPCLPDE